MSCRTRPPFPLLFFSSPSPHLFRLPCCLRCFNGPLSRFSPRLPLCCFHFRLPFPYPPRQAATLDSFGRSASILHGELYGILFARSSSPSLPIYNDHLYTVRLLCDALQHPPPSHSWTSLPARSLYRWILSALRSFPSSSPPSLLHVRAHTGGTDPVSLANDFVDRLASGAHTSFPPPHPVPIPTFCMDKFTPYLPPFSFIDSHLPSLLDSLLASRSFYDLSFAPFHTLRPFFYDSFGLPPHPYLRASSAFSTVAHLYARSAQLPTNVPLASRFGDRSAFCRFGCPVLEDPIISSSFVQPFRTSATTTRGRSFRTSPIVLVGPHYHPLFAPTLTTSLPTFSEVTTLGPCAPLFSTWGSFLLFYLTPGVAPLLVRMLIICLFAWRIPVIPPPFVSRDAFGALYFGVPLRPPLHRYVVGTLVRRAVTLSCPHTFVPFSLHS